MSLPTPTAIDGAVKSVTNFAAGEISKLGVTVDQGQIEAVVSAAIDAICMKGWRAAHAAGQAAAAAITTEAQAEAAQREK